MRNLNSKSKIQYLKFLFNKPQVTNYELRVTIIKQLITTNYYELQLITMYYKKLTPSPTLKY